MRVCQHPLVSAEIERELTHRFGIKRACPGPTRSYRCGNAALWRGEPGCRSFIEDPMTARSSLSAWDVMWGLWPTMFSIKVSVSVSSCALSGGSLRAGEYMNPDHICRHLAVKFGGDSEMLYVLALVQKPELRDAMYENSAVRQTFDRGRWADTALISVGGLSERQYRCA